MVTLEVGQWPRTEYWQIHDNGHIGRTTSDGFVVQPSDGWRALRAAERNNFGIIVRFYELNFILARKVPWLFKNGKQRCFLHEYDHGSIVEVRQPHQVY